MELKYRKADINDLDLYFDWVNDKNVRINAIQKESILYEDHVKWFKSKIEDSNSILLVFTILEEPIGQIRMEFDGNSWLIDYSVDLKQRGKGFGSKMIDQLLKKYTNRKFKAVVWEKNKSSINIFKKFNFILKEETKIKNELYLIYEK